MADDRSKSDDILEMIWDDARVAMRRGPTPHDEAIEQLRQKAQPGDMVIGTSRERILVVVKADGRIELGPDYRPDEAAMVFWEAIGRQRAAYEDRSLLIQHMEAILTRMGAADLRVEQLRMNAAAGDQASAQAAGAALVHLERLVHQAIELGRGLARRPEMPIPEVPEKVPERIKANPQSAYQGQEGLKPDPDPDPTPNRGTGGQLN